MKAIHLSIIAFLLLIINDACGQASWTYELRFDLYDKNGAIISPKEFEEGKVSLYTMPEGAHSENELKYDSVKAAFRFSQHTIAGSSMPVLVSNTDTAVFEISTHPGQVARLELLNGTFELRKIRADGGRFEYETTARPGHPDFSLSKQAFYDRISGEFREMTFSDLKKVELE